MAAEQWGLELSSSKSGLSVLGLGLMNSALAASLAKAGHQVTVWNRSESKAEPIARMGAFSAQNVEAAVAASQITIVCQFERRPRLRDRARNLDHCTRL
jgi:glutamyl-tRNA reductase